MATTEQANVNVNINGEQAEETLKILKNRAIEVKKAAEEAFKAGDIKAWEKHKKELSDINKEAKGVQRQMFDIDKVLKNLSGASLKDINRTVTELNKRLTDGSVKRGSAEWKELTNSVKLATAEKRKINDEMGKTRQNTFNLMGAFKQMLPVLGLGGGIAGAFNFLKGVILSTDLTTDKFEQTMGGLKESFNFIKQSIATLDFSNLITGFRDAYRAGRDYAEALGLIGDLQRSIGIQKIDIEMEISKQRAIAKNRSLDLKSREAALDKIIELEKQKMDIVKDVADFELEETSKLILSRDKSLNVTQDQLVELFSNYKKYDSVIKEGISLQNKLDEASKTYYTNARTGMGGWVIDSKKYKTAYDSLTDSEKEAIETAKIHNLVADDQRDNLTKIISSSKQAALELVKSEEALVRLQNSLRNELLKEEDEDEEDPVMKINKVVDALKTGLEELQAMQPLDADGVPIIPGFPSEIELRERGEMILEIASDTSLSQQEIWQQMYEQGLISYQEYFEAMQVLNAQEVAAEQAKADKKKALIQNSLQAAQTLTAALYNFNVAAMNRELKAAGDNEKKKEEINKKYAEKQKQIAIIQAIINTALAVMQALANYPPPISYVLAAASGILGAAEIAVISSQQFASGRYPVMGASDGQMYDAQYVGAPKTGIQRGPALVSERGDEMIVDGPTTSKLVYQYPEIVRGIKELSMGLNPQFANGRMPSVTREIRTEAFTDPELASILVDLRDEIRKGINAKVITNEDNLETWNKAQDELTTFKSKVNAG